jgi:hypothetical protein
MTRALSCATHGHPRRALAYNSRVVIVLPLLLWAWARGLRREWRTFRAVYSSMPKADASSGP